MRILLDNCVNQRFGRLLVGHDTVHARQMEWAELKNGDLIAAADTNGYPAIVTTDKKMRHQQSLAGRRVSVAVPGSKRLTLRHIAPLAGKVPKAIENLPPGEFIVIEPD